MKRLFFLLFIICAFTMTFAQQLTVKNVNLRPQDARARTNPRDDARGKKCAIIRVGVVGVEDLVFPDAVGEVDRSLSEYVVYVPEGLKKLVYNNKSGEKLGVIDFDDYDLEVNSLASYDVVFESTSHLRSAIFSISPSNAKLTLNGKKVDISADGIAMSNLPVGDYSYNVEADGFVGQSGTVSLIEDEISTLTDVILEQELHPVAIHVIPETATIFIDDAPYNTESLSDLKLPVGEHKIRLTAPNYKDEEQTFDVKYGENPLYYVMKEVKQEVIKHTEERTRTKISIRNAFYITGSFAMGGVSDKNSLFGKGNTLDFGAELSAVQHFAGIFGVREGICFNVIKPNGNEKYFDLSVYNDSTRYLTHIDVPLQFGISLPFGKYNRHLFSVFAGGYGSYIWMQEKWAEKELSAEDRKREIKDPNKDDKDYWDYGIRLSAKLDIGHFTIGADFNHSLHDMGFSAGFNIGMKLYSLHKKH